MVTRTIELRASKPISSSLKAMLLSKVAVAARGALLLAYFLGPIRFDPTILIGATTAIVGGVVVFGSNSSTAKQIMAAMKDGEGQRAKLIDFGAADASRWPLRR
jgi:hypothetical protein